MNILILFPFSLRYRESFFIFRLPLGLSRARPHFLMFVVVVVVSVVFTVVVVVVVSSLGRAALPPRRVHPPRRFTSSAAWRMSPLLEDGHRNPTKEHRQWEKLTFYVVHSSFSPSSLHFYYYYGRKYCARERSGGKGGSRSPGSDEMTEEEVR